MLTLHIANKNYSSWSLRPWVLMKALAIPFEEVLHRFGYEEDWQAYRKQVQSGLVPALVEGDVIVWDSLAIIERLAESYPAVWPADATARAWARSTAAEMHSGFSALRNMCSMSCGQRVELHDVSEALNKDVSRIDALWQEGLAKFGGPFLAGDQFTAVDAFYAPVVFRFQTYGLKLSEISTSYLQQMLNVPAMKQWYDEALQEIFRDLAHEEEIKSFGKVVSDSRQN